MPVPSIKEAPIMPMMILLRTLPQSEFSAVEPGGLDYSGKNDDEIR